MKTVNENLISIYTNEGTLFISTVSQFPMNLAEKSKRALAIIILICFFLPLAQCSTKAPVGSGSVSKSEAPMVLVPASDIKFESFDEVPLIAMYIWPLGFIGLRRLIQKPKHLAYVSGVEILLAGSALYCVIQTIQLWGTIRYGGVILVAAYFGYILAAAFTLYRNLHGPFNNSLLGNIGAISMLAFILAVGEIVFASTWINVLYAILVAVLALIVFLISIKGSQLRKSGVPKNTQLQNVPPAIIEKIKNDI